MTLNFTDTGKLWRGLCSYLHRPVYQYVLFSIWEGPHLCHSPDPTRLPLSVFASPYPKSPLRRPTHRPQTVKKILSLTNPNTNKLATTWHQYNAFLRDKILCCFSQISTLFIQLLKLRMWTILLLLRSARPHSWSLL